MEANQIIAENLKRLRTERNLSLGQLAELSEVSKVMLSQIEKGDTNPTINTIWKIANGLKVPYTALLEQQENDTIIVKKTETAIQTGNDKHYRIFCYYPNTPQRNFELFQIELDAEHSYTSVGHSEKSQEYILVLEGNLCLTVNNETYD
ncbi:MAG TPA: XRE family transcriptional regulator, partial [Caproiciproducens sp.]|nr:XRE family transcriptional regulator [Caproiciproducens sp.]